MLNRLVLVCSIMLVGIVSQAQVSYSLGNEAAYIEQSEKEAARSGNDSVQAYRYLKLSLLYRRVNDTTQSRRFLEKGIATGERYTFLKTASIYYTAIIKYG